MPTVVARLRRGESGQGLTEFALIAPVLMMLICGVFDFGRGMSANVTVTNSSREGARFLATQASAVTAPLGSSSLVGCYGTGSSPSAPAVGTAQSQAWKQMQNASLDMSKVSMEVDFYAAKNNNDPSLGGAPDDVITCVGGAVHETATGYQPATGDWVTFKVTYTYSPATPLVEAVVHSVTVSQQTTMVLE